MQIRGEWVTSHSGAPFTGNIFKPKVSFYRPQVHQLIWWPRNSSWVLDWACRIYAHICLSPVPEENLSSVRHSIVCNPQSFCLKRGLDPYKVLRTILGTEKWHSTRWAGLSTKTNMYGKLLTDVGAAAECLGFGLPHITAGLSQSGHRIHSPPPKEVLVRWHLPWCSACALQAQNRGWALLWKPVRNQLLIPSLRHDFPLHISSYACFSGSSKMISNLLDKCFLLQSLM